MHVRRLPLRSSGDGNDPGETVMARTLALAATLMLASTAALADPGYYLVTVYENEGKANIDFRYWDVRFPRSTVKWPEIGIGYGVTKRWYTALLASYVTSPGTPVSLDTQQWQNDFLLTQGQYDFDLALHTNLIHEKYDGENTIEFGPVFQTEIGRMQLNGNLFFDRGLAAGNSTTPELKYQWQAKYRWKPAFQFGLRGFGEVGPWNNWAPRSRQSHRAGPMISGAIPFGTSDSFNYEAAFLFGSAYSTHADMLTLRLQYEF